MTQDEIRETLRRVKFCMRRQIEISCGTGKYYVTAIVLRHSQSEDFIYSVELTDANRINTTITIGLEGAEFPTEGGKWRLADRSTTDRVPEEKEGNPSN